MAGGDPAAPYPSPNSVPSFAVAQRRSVIDVPRRCTIVVVVYRNDLNAIASWARARRAYKPQQTHDLNEEAAQVWLEFVSRHL